MDTPAAHKWAAVLADAETSGLPIRQFARSRGLNPSTVAWWKWRLKQSPIPQPARFMPVVVAQPEHPQPPVLEVRIAGAVVVIDDHTDLTLVRRLVQALT